MNHSKAIHLSSFIAIIITSSVALYSIDFGTLPELKRITLSLAIAFLAVSTLAVIYMFLTNTALTTALNEVETLSRNIDKNAETIRSETVLTGEKMGVFSNHVQEVIRHISKNSEGVPTFQPDNSVDQILGDRVLRNSSPMGLLFLYAAVLAHQKKVDLDLKTLTSTLGMPNGSELYLQGWLMATGAAGLFSVHFDDQLMATISVFNEPLLTQLHTRIPEKISALKTEGDPEYAKDIASKLQGINTYFEMLNP